MRKCKFMSLLLLYTETDINFLLKMSLDTIGTLPFSLALEQWRWDVFADKIPQEEWMQHWWQLK